MYVILILHDNVIFRKEYEHMKLPSHIEDAKNIGRVLSRYKDKYYSEVLSAVFVVYILYPFCMLNDCNYYLKMKCILIVSILISLFM